MLLGEQESPVGSLLDRRQREAAADVVNVQMLSLSMQQPRRRKQMVPNLACKHACALCCMPESQIWRQ